MILTFLQNAWFHRKLFSGFERDDTGAVIKGEDGLAIPKYLTEWGDEWRQVWLFATARSRSGQRLKVMLGDDCFERDDCAFADASPKVSYGSSAGRFDGDEEWCLSEIAKCRPTMVVCCGNEAIDTVSPIWPGAIVCVPHPTSRVVTNALYRDAGVFALRAKTRRRLRFTQQRGGHTFYDLPPIAVPQ